MPGIYLTKNNNGYLYYNAVFNAPASANNAVLDNIYHDDFNKSINTVLYYQVTGTYFLISDQAIFDFAKTSVFLTNVYKASDIIPSVIIWNYDNPYQLSIRTYRTSTGALFNTGFKLNIEIRNYYNYIYSSQ